MAPSATTRSTAARRATVSRRARWPALPAAAASAALLLAGCSGPSAPRGTGVVHAVAAESHYGDVLRQIGGRDVEVSSILHNPSIDAHSYEATPSVAREVAAAELVVQNGLGYDGFMDRIEAASPDAGRKVLVAQHVLGVAGTTRNPHLWYDPRTMPAMARAMAGALAALRPARAADFQANLRAFDASLAPWQQAVAGFKAHHAGVPVATTEPVADDLLRAMGADNLTPFSFQADVMNGVDPPPQDISRVQSLLRDHKVKVLCFNPQVVSPLTASIRRSAVDAGVPVVGVYETMPTPGYDYQTWMLEEVQAIEEAVAHGVSTERL